MKIKELTINETIDEIRYSLQEYIEATYHISHPSLVQQRKELLDKPGAIFQLPYLESTPKYRTGRSLSDLNIPEAAKELLKIMALRPEPLIYDPLYLHQVQAIEATISNRKNLVLTTGTGSGKTESFLLPILSKLAIEAATSPGSFAEPSVRAVLLYPMNALVNDQLSRLRLILGDESVAGKFSAWSGRPARFARYTSRTPYPGIRTVNKDQKRLRSVHDFYIYLINLVNNSDDIDSQIKATKLIENLKLRGKWPAKPDIEAWYGNKGERWKRQDGEFQRAVMQLDDPELITRHEVLANAPDIFVTNYSMLEYMLMRPLERPIFDNTRKWLMNNKDERLILVVDEAHLYRGAAGSEVGLLLRRFRDRLGIPAERLQVICTSASFNDSSYAAKFAADLTGTNSDSFLTLTGELALREGANAGGKTDAEVLANISVADFYGAESESERLGVVQKLLSYRGVVSSSSSSSSTAIFKALQNFPPMSYLVNLTMQNAKSLDELTVEIFPGVEDKVAKKALSTLVALGSTARKIPGEPGLLPCRVHAFFRGLPGIWACINDKCNYRGEFSDSPVGCIWSQPRYTCYCGSRVFELFTCRNCGVAYARTYTNNIELPTYLWSEPGGAFDSVDGHVNELYILDILLEKPSEDASVEIADLDLVTGQLNPNHLGEHVRRVFLCSNRIPAPSIDENTDELTDMSSREFRPCGVCNQTAAYGRTSVQDHQTKGDQPFQSLIARQLLVQPPSPQPVSDFAPLQGRKVLIFSDSRQTAARLAPNLQDYSMRDTLRPLILVGWGELSNIPELANRLILDDLYLAVLLASQRLKVRLRPKLKSTESLHTYKVEQALDNDALSSLEDALEFVIDFRSNRPPESLMRAIHETLTHKYLGLASLALATVCEQGRLTAKLEDLPDLPNVTDPIEKVMLTRMWLSQWLSHGYWFRNMAPSFWKTPGGIRPHSSGNFSAVKRWLVDRETVRSFKKLWLPQLLDIFTETVSPSSYRILAEKLALETDGEWGYCQACRSTQRPFPGMPKCISCGRRGTVISIDPDTDSVFVARKGYYRTSSMRALGPESETPFALIAAEHTAQLNAAQVGEVFSRAEKHELLFQDVDITLPDQEEQEYTAIDVLSSTTTMEVGIDIGTLSGVALRNMPPARSSYQQRAGRAGRRGNSIATVVAFGSSDSHDEHYFRDPQAMIRGKIEDPTLTLNNAIIARRHVTAYLFQCYHQSRLPYVKPADQPQLFEVLGTVQDFLDEESTLNRYDFEEWLYENENELQNAISDWLPDLLSPRDRNNLLKDLIHETLEVIDDALLTKAATGMNTDPEVLKNIDNEIVEPLVEVYAEVDEERSTAVRSSTNLLDRLLYKGVLPRYAFPTDVVSFHVFDLEQSTRFRPEFEYAPNQGLPVALTQYAPGKKVWIDGKEWTSGAIYSSIGEDRSTAWQNCRLYFECTICGYAKTTSLQDAERGESRDCPACGGKKTFGSAKKWMRPPGFAHPQFLEEGTSTEDQPGPSYATRAKLMAEGPTDNELWQVVAPRIRKYFHRDHLLVTNSGPRRKGYTYCTRCGVIEPTSLPSSGDLSREHKKPYPDNKEPICRGSAVTHGLVLGTDFISDVLLIRLQFDSPVILKPGKLATNVALRSLAEAITIAASRILEIEKDELQAEYRPALTPNGHSGLEAEIYVYDTLPGGAGFAQQVGDMGDSIFVDALQVLKDCPSECDHSCYRCLRSFKNRFEHGLLDRHVGANLLDYLLKDVLYPLNEERLESSIKRLFIDLDRLGIEGVEFKHNTIITIPGFGIIKVPILAQHSEGELIIGVHSPLTPNFAMDEELRKLAKLDIASICLVNEIWITRNLPKASGLVLDKLGLQSL